MNMAISFGQVVRERRGAIGLTQAELARRAGCAPVTVRKIEADLLRPSVQLAELLALALNVPEAEQLAFVRLARDERPPSPLPKPTPSPGEIGLADLSGRSVKGFELAERIGSGGFGVVYRALQPSVQRDVAVKIILPRFANHPTFIRRFEAEAHLVARLEHPHIVPLYDYWREPDAAYLIMRLLRGGSLVDQLGHGPLSLPVAWRMVQQVGEALAVAHAQGVIHRDIKPANVLLDDTQNAYLADFGIAKNLAANEESLTEGGALLGSPAYISPEQIKAEPLHPASDIYCFGLMLYEMLTGQRAFQGPTPLAYLQQHLNEPVPSLLTIVPDVPPALDAILQHATAKEPAARFREMTVLLAALEAVMHPTLSDLAVPIVGETAVSPILTIEEIAALDNPYRGLRAFTEADAANFFGRETLVQELLSLMSDGSDLERFLAVVGPSGSGKSSLVKAGLLPALRRGGLPGSDNWFMVDLTPSSHPWEEVEAAMLRVAVNPPESLLAQLKEDDRGLLRVVQRCLPNDGETELLLLIDQFEELFTLVEDEAVRTHFLQSLVTAVLDPQSRLRVVFTLRADFMDRPLQYADFGELMQQRLSLVLPLMPDELAQAITQPVANLRMIMEPELVATILHDVGEQPGMLPLLQYALTELFVKRQGQILTLDIYRETGGVTGALARRADEIYNNLNESARQATRQLFLRLITLGEGVEDTRRRVLRSEFEALTPVRSSLVEDAAWFETQETILNLYGSYRLLTFDRDPVTRSPTVEVAHEALLREWPRLRLWLKEGREDIRRQRELSTVAEQWRASSQDDSYLLRGSRLIGFEDWWELTLIALTRHERIFLRTSIAARDKRQADEGRRQRREMETIQKLAEAETARADIAARRAQESSRNLRRLRLFAAGLVVLLLAAAGTAWFANTQRLQAQDNFVISERIRLASQAQNALERGEGAEVAALLALRSLQLGYSPEADLALQGALQIGFSQQQYVGHDGAIWGTEFSQDGRFVVTSGGDSIIRLWDAQTGQEIRQFLGHEASVNNVNISPDGKLLASASPDNTVRIWDINTGAEIRRITGLTGGGWNAEFTPDGQFLLTIDAVTAKLWEVATGNLVREFVGHTDEIYFSSISPDGLFLATVSNDETVRLWDMQTGAEIRQFLGHTGWIGGADFSPDGRYLLTTGEDGIARIWDVATGLEMRRLLGHTSEIFDGRFSPDGQFVVTSGYDRTARLWDVASGQQIRLLRGHTNTLGEANFSPDGQLLLTSSADGTARLWDIWAETEPVEYGPFGGVHTQSQSTLTLSSDRRFSLVGRTQGSVEIWDNEQDKIVQKFQLVAEEVSAGAFSADNQTVLIATSDGIIHLWDRLTETDVHQFMGHEGYVRSVAFSPDGRRVLSGGEDGTVRLWDVASGAEIRQFSDHQGPVRSVVFSADGQAILTGSNDGTAREWDIESGALRHQIELPGTAILAVIYVPNSSRIIVAGDDRMAHLWDLETGQEVQSFSGHSDAVTHLAISPDAKLLLTGSNDQTARVWELASGQELRRFGNHTSSILFVAFSEDGQHVYSGATGFVYVWRTAMPDVVAFACDQLGRDLTAAEREFYNLDDSNTCSSGNAQIAQAMPTWTPIASTPLPIDAVQTIVDIELINMDMAYIQMGNPLQHVYIETDDGMVIRPDNLEPETLTLPLFATADYVDDDFIEPPFDRGPYPMGIPLGVNLERWLEAKGSGTYHQQGAKATIDFQFDGLLPGGVYTLWCVTYHNPDFAWVIEKPCGAPDGTENIFIADENGQAELQLEIDAFPPSTDEVIYELAVAYHSDGQTHGEVVGDYSKNVHIVLFHDFLPPE